LTKSALKKRYKVWKKCKDAAAAEEEEEEEGDVYIVLYCMQCL
jgi:hypothetical protein